MLPLIDMSFTLPLLDMSYVPITYIVHCNASLDVHCFRLAADYVIVLPTGKYVHPSVSPSVRPSVSPSVINALPPRIRANRTGRASATLSRTRFLFRYTSRAYRRLDSSIRDGH